MMVAAALVGMRSWLASHDAAAKLAATMTAQQNVIAQVAARQQQRAANLSKTVSAIAHAKRRVTTAREAATELPNVLPLLPRPIPPLQIAEPGPEVPEPSATVNIPQADLKPLYDAMQDCRACQARLEAAQQDLSDERETVAALTRERDAAIDASRGGRFWTRIAKTAKWIAVGAALGATVATSLRK